MSIIKNTVKFNNLDINLKFTLGTDDNFLGYQQEIDNLTTATKEELINPVVDAEVRRFKYMFRNSPMNIKFYFGTSHNMSFVQAGFTVDEILTNDKKLLNSFFILDFYDTFDNNTQTKIFSTYLTKVLSGVNNTANYRIYSDTVNQLYNWYVPLSYINAQTGTTVIGYTKFSFFNAKTGVIALFYNNSNAALLTPEKMYFKTELNLSDMTWSFLNTSNAEAYQVSTTSAYVTKVNNTVDNFENKKQVFPTGSTFDYVTGTYVET
jgi:hypothetical protein